MDEKESCGVRREDERGHTLWRWLRPAGGGGGRGSVSWLLQVQVQPALPGGTATKGPEHLSLKESRELVQVIRNKHRAIKKTMSFTAPV